MRAHIYVTLKDGVLDPQGRAIQQALGHLQFAGVESVRQGKYFTVDLAANDQTQAETQVTAMCKALLANEVIEDFRFEFEG